MLIIFLESLIKTIGIARTPVDVTIHLSKNKRESVSQVEYSRVIVTPQNPGCPLTTRQPAEFYVSHVMKHTHE